MEQLPWLSALGRRYGLYHAFSTLTEGNQGFRFGSKAGVIACRSRLLRAARAAAGGISAFHLPRGVWMVPMRTGCEEVITVVGPVEAGRGAMAPDSGPLCEAVITTSSEIHLGVAVADCAPIIIFDPVCRRLALVHASRESTARGIAGKAVEYLVRYYQTDPADLIVGIGPGIRKESYLLQHFGPAADAASPWRRNDRLMVLPEGVLLDLPGRNRDILIERGVRPERIDISPANTSIDRQFFSHRRAKATGEPEGRHACVVWMAPA